VPLADDFPQVQLILAHLGYAARRAVHTTCRCGRSRLPNTATCWRILQARGASCRA
jgi:hypothetical protein